MSSLRCFSNSKRLSLGNEVKNRAVRASRDAMLFPVVVHMVPAWSGTQGCLRLAALLTSVGPVSGYFFHIQRGALGSPCCHVRQGAPRGHL